MYVIGTVLVYFGIIALLNKLGFKLKTPKKYEDYIKGEKGRSGKHLE